MKYLVICPCSHAITEHLRTGCSGERGMCSCQLDESRALEAAIQTAQSHPWSYPARRGDDRS